ncbi:dicarboxylate/amino acid:cation symporter [Clostridium sp. KNHs216]|uniref:dicarboxylate/amino acid:cation symporter n=1 Tax=Clostridium sp. KNHs216 TaxID=1550235 RepID=UPI001169D737|nr:dicarboxylate/amino acid:cation symporter [Clostridium sp. KNHs216]TQI67714.1 Na+/H+-dicarboxylate symporter [Clostridium sp. KNHs216]
MATFFKNNKFPFILLGSMLAGSILGAFWGSGATVLSPIADIFLNLLYCCVVPMIFVSLVSSIANMENLKKLGKILGVMMLIFILTEIIASVYMAVICGVFDPAKGAQIAMNEKVEDLTSNNNFLSMFTVNDFSLLWSRKSLMALIVFSMISGVAVVAVGEKGKPVMQFFDSLSAVIMKMVGYVMLLAPIGLGAFFATLIGQYGGEIVGPLSRSLVIYLIAAVVYYALSNTLFAFIGGGAIGVKRFWKPIISPTLTSLGTCSSAASIPAELIAAKQMHISDDVANITIPMGANLHKDGACLITILKIAFMCSVFHVNFLDPHILFTAILVSVVASTVMGAIPAGGYVGEIFIISAFGFPEVSIPIMVLIGTITDAPATAINSTGDTGVAMIVARIMEGKNWLKDKIAAEEKEEISGTTETA